MRLVYLCLASLLFTLNAFAVSVEFKFDVNSSGPSIYACNAGIKHQAHSDRVCYDRVTAKSCSPANDCRNEVDCNCVCTGSTTADGETRHDFLTVSSAEWTDNGVAAGPAVIKNLYAPETAFNVAFNESAKEEWTRQLTKMSVNLGSERFGAEFFLDICYRGPQIEYYFAAQNGGFGSAANATPNFAVKAQATVNDIVSTNGLRYSQLADLKVRAQVVCDQQGKGNYLYAGSHSPAGQTTYDTVLTDIVGVSIGGGQYSKNVNLRDFNSYNSAYLVDEFINVNNAFTPRFCKIRYSFIENRRNDQNVLAQLRKWKLQKAEVCTFTEINEEMN
jgi:hypothetical protein